MCIYIGYLLQNDTFQRCKLTSNMNEPNKLDHRCPLKQGNTQSNYLVHNTDILKNFKLTNIQIPRI